MGKHVGNNHDTVSGTRMGNVQREREHGLLAGISTNIWRTAGTSSSRCSTGTTRGDGGSPRARTRDEGTAAAEGEDAQEELTSSGEQGRKPETRPWPGRPGRGGRRTATRGRRDRKRMRRGGREVMGRGEDTGEEEDERRPKVGDGGQPRLGLPGKSTGRTRPTAAGGAGAGGEEEHRGEELGEPGRRSREAAPGEVWPEADGRGGRHGIGRKRRSTGAAGAGPEEGRGGAGGGRPPRREVEQGEGDGGKERR